MITRTGIEALTPEGQTEAYRLAKEMVAEARRANGNRLDGRRLYPPGPRPEAWLGLGGGVRAIAWRIADKVLSGETLLSDLP